VWSVYNDEGVSQGGGRRFESARLHHLASHSNAHVPSADEHGRAHAFVRRPIASPRWMGSYGRLQASAGDPGRQGKCAAVGKLGCREPGCISSCPSRRCET
jgi:Ni,Fe-hydrogenase I small subunit